MGHARLARLRSCIRRSRQVTPQAAKDNVFKPNLLEVARKLVPVASPCRRHRVTPGAGTRRPRGTLDAGHGPGWGKTGFKAIGITTRERACGSCHLWFWQFFLGRLCDCNVSLHRTAHQPAGCPAVRASPAEATA